CTRVCRLDHPDSCIQNPDTSAVSCFLVNLFLLVLRLLAGSRLFLSRQEQQQRGVGVSVTKAQHPCGSCSRTANVVSSPKSKFIHLSSKDREPPLLHHLTGDLLTARYADCIFNEEHFSAL
uniref:Uncharacterized protein n=1 Tax=Oryza glaberrima TaxID=4538 RepID=I1R8P5_ORYGL